MVWAKGRAGSVFTRPGEMRLKIKILVLREFYIVRSKKDFVSAFFDPPRRF